MSETSSNLLKHEQEEVDMSPLSFAFPISNGLVRLDYAAVTI